MLGVSLFWLIFVTQLSLIMAACGIDDGGKHATGRLINEKVVLWHPTSVEDALTLFYNRTEDCEFTDWFVDEQIVIRYTFHPRSYDGPSGFKFKYKFSGDDKRTVLSALREFEKKTCMHFQQIFYDHLPEKSNFTYMNFLKHAGDCYQFLPNSGRRTGSNDMPVNPDCSFHSFYSLQRIIMLALGFMWEHDRPDRDLYIDINYSCILPKYRHLFDKVKGPAKYCPFLFAPEWQYDYASIMHFDPSDFDDIECKVLKPANRNPAVADRFTDDRRKFSNAKTFSTGDDRKIKEYYNCSAIATIRKEIVAKYGHNGSLKFPASSRSRSNFQDASNHRHNNWRIAFGPTGKGAKAKKPHVAHYLRALHRPRSHKRSSGRCYRSVDEQYQAYVYETLKFTIPANERRYCLNFWYGVEGEGDHHSSLRVLQSDNVEVWNSSGTRNFGKWQEVSITRPMTRKRMSLRFIGRVAEHGGIGLYDILIDPCNETVNENDV